MSGKTNPVSKQTLQRFLGIDALKFANPVYVNLLTASPSSDGPDANTAPTVTEWSASRKPVYNSQTTADVVSNTTPYWGGLTLENDMVQISNQRTIGWDSTDLDSVGTNITVNAVAVFDAENSGNLLYWEELTVSRIVNNGDTFQFGVDRLKIRED